MKSYIFIITLLCSFFTWGQVTIVSDGLNNSSSLFSTSGGAYYSGSLGVTDAPAFSPYYSEGTHAYGKTNGTATLTSSTDINTVGYASVTMSLRLASFSLLTILNGADNSDSVKVEVSPDGGTTWYSTLVVTGNNNAYWSYSAGEGIATTPYDGDTTPVTYAPADGGYRTTDGYSTLNITNLPSVTNLRFKITLTNSNSAERWLVDDFKIEGIAIPEINIQGLGNSITDGDTTPSISDDTDFGSTLISTNNTHIFTIQNTGISDLILPSNPVTLSNLTNGFSITQPALLTIPSSSSTTFSITFNNASAGIYTNTISIANNDTDENPYDFSITAQATLPAPEINISKDMASSDIPSGSVASAGFNTVFTTTDIGSSSFITYYIENEGTADLDVSGVSVLGTNSGDFIVSAIPSTIAVGSTLTSSVSFTVTFSPLASGLRTATISILNNDSDESPYTFDVEGMGNCTSNTSSLSPSSGPEGTIVTISSSLDLSISNTVTLNGETLSSTIISPSQISIEIPPGASTGDVIVSNYQDCSTTTSFTVIENVNSSCEGGAASSSGELFMSEITDSNSGGLTYIELYNGTGSSIDLSTYSIEFYNNGSATNNGGTVTLPSFSLPDGEVYVVAVGTGGTTCSGVFGADASLADFDSATGGINFSVGGNDHIKLFNGATEVDQWGVYSSSTWADGLGLGTAGADFRRNNTATLPSTSFSTSDWSIFNWASCSESDYSNIGAYYFSDGTPPVVTSQPIYAPSCGTVTLTTSAIEGFTGGLGVVYQWYFNAPGSSSWFALTNTGVYSGVSTASLLISSTSGLDNYQYYCEVKENSNTCYSATNAVTIYDDVSSWNGFWWVNGTPTITKKAVISGDYNTGTNGSFECCSLLVNSSKTLTISSNTYLNIDNDIINNGIINIEDSGSLIQTNETDTNTGTYTNNKVYRTALASKHDYVYWSSPVQNFAVGNLPNANRYAWSTTAINANGTEGNWTVASGAMSRGVGYIAKASNGSDTPIALTTIFTGKPNNGEFNVAITRGSDVESLNDNYNLLGNPYPSAIDVTSFLYENADSGGPNPVIEGSIRLWSHGASPLTSNPSPFYENFGYNYSESDYIVHNGAGTTSGPSGFNGKIASGQGFFVIKQETGPTSSVVNFKNSMRDKSYDNSTFFKLSNENSSTTSIIDRNRIWLDLIAQDGKISRTLVAYITGATFAKDVMYDAAIEPTAMCLYTLIDTKKQIIQGRPVPFNSNDLVPIGMLIKTAGSYTIAISAVDGLFSNTSQNIYLEDTTLNIIHNLTLSPYTFTTQVGEFNNRFVLRYANETLSNPSFDTEGDFTIIANEKITIQSSEIIQSVIVIDVLGRTLFTQEGINTTATTLEKFKPTKEVIIVKTTLDNGRVISKKIIY